MSTIRNLSLFADLAVGNLPANILAAARALAIHLARSRPLDRRLVAEVMTTAFGASDAEGVRFANCGSWAPCWPSTSSPCPCWSWA